MLEEWLVLGGFSIVIVIELVFDGQALALLVGNMIALPELGLTTKSVCVFQRVHRRVCSFD